MNSDQTKGTFCFAREEGCLRKQLVFTVGGTSYCKECRQIHYAWLKLPLAKYLVSEIYRLAKLCDHSL